MEWMEFAKVALGIWEFTPSEFWEMTPLDWWLVFDGKKRLADERAGRMTQKDYAELKASLSEKGIEV
jgi:hypothetical protein